MKKVSLKSKPLPKGLGELMRLMLPMAIRDDIQHGKMVGMIDRLMQIETLSADQGKYLETLVELVEAYEAKRNAIDVSKSSGLQMRTEPKKRNEQGKAQSRK